MGVSNYDATNMNVIANRARLVWCLRLSHAASSNEDMKNGSPLSVPKKKNFDVSETVCVHNQE